MSNVIPLDVRRGIEFIVWEYPPFADKNIEPGCMIRVGTINESFWVKTVLVRENVIIGRVDSRLYGADDLKYGDLVEFKRENVMDCWSKNVNLPKF